MINEVRVQGKLKSSPTLKVDYKGVKRTMFTIACERDKSELREGSPKDADFIDCIAWGRKADRICSTFRQDDEVVVAGRIQTSRVYVGNIQVKTVEIKISGMEYYHPEDEDQESVGEDDTLL